MNRYLPLVRFLILTFFLLPLFKVNSIAYLSNQYNPPFHSSASIISKSDFPYIDFIIDNGSENAQVLSAQSGIVSNIYLNESPDSYGYSVEIECLDGSVTKYSKLSYIYGNLKINDDVSLGDFLGLQGKDGFRFEVSSTERILKAKDYFGDIDWSVNDVQLNNSNYKPLFIVKKSGADMALDVPNFRFDEGLPILLYKTHGGINQMWRLDKIDDYYKIVSVLNEKVLSVISDSTGTFTLVQSKFEESDSQLWKIKHDNSGCVISSKLNGLLLNFNENSNALYFSQEIGKGSYWDLLDVKNYSNSVLSPTEMLTDVDYYIQNLKETHPNIYGYSSEKTVNRSLYNLKKAINKPLRYSEFYSLISQMNILFDGHTHIYRLGENIKHSNTYAMVDNNLFFPYNVSFDGDRIYLNDSIDGQYVNLEIISINNISTEDIRNAISRNWNFENIRMNQLNIENYFWLSLHSILGIQGPWFDIKVKEEGRTRFVLKKGLTATQVQSKPSIVSRVQPYSFHLFDKESIALIEYNVCPMQQLDRLEVFMKDCFNKIKEKNIKHVFVDISRNGGGGGNETNKHLYNRINHKASSWESNMYVKKKDLNRIVKEVSPQYNNEVNDGYPYNIYVIQSNLTYSAAVGISVWFKYTSRGVLIGEETGGTTAAYIFTPEFSLPNSKIKFRVSTTLWEFPENPALDQGVLPDIPYKIDFKQTHFDLDTLKMFVEKAKLIK